MKCTLPRWLNIHDIAIQVDYTFDALVEFFYAFLSNSDQTLYKNQIENIEKNTRFQWK